MNRRTFLIAATGSMAASALLNRAWAQTRGELQERMRQRFARLVELKRDGRLGETWEGYIGIVSPDDRDDQELTRLMREENDDRRALYELIAEEQETEAEVVARRNAVRNFERARRGEYLRGRDGQWTQKK